jgi:hypothetical protein
MGGIPLIRERSIRAVAAIHPTLCVVAPMAMFIAALGVMAVGMMFRSVLTRVLSAVGVMLAAMFRAAMLSARVLLGVMFAAAMAGVPPMAPAAMMAAAMAPPSLGPAGDDRCANHRRQYVCCSPL